MRARGRTELDRDTVLSLLQRCHFVASADGVLTIEPQVTDLNAEELARITDRLLESDHATGWREIRFDLRHVHRFGDQWTAVLAMFIMFARRVNAPCRLASLHGQPAAVASLYRRDPELQRLVVADSGED